MPHHYAMAQPEGRLVRKAVCTAAVLIGCFAAIGRAAPAPQNPAAQSPCPASLHCATVPAERFAWLAKSKAGDSSRDAVLADEFQNLVASITPDSIYHFHVDMPLASAFTVMMRGPAQPIGVRNERYVTLSACINPSCSGGRALLWIDTESRLAIGAIEFNPANGEPAPTETLFSSQILDVITESSQLPEAFLADLRPWSKASRFRKPMVRYFINGRAFKTPVSHDDDSCAGGDRSSLPLSLCAAMNVEAADQDVQAAFYLLVNSYARGTSPRTQLQDDQQKWTHDRQTACGMGGTIDALACQLKYTRDRLRALTDLYVKPMKPSDR